MSPEFVALWQGGPGDLTGWLAGHGWRPTVHDLPEVAADYGRTVPPELTRGGTDAGRAWLATATWNTDLPS